MDGLGELDLARGQVVVRVLGQLLAQEGALGAALLPQPIEIEMGGQQVLCQADYILIEISLVDYNIGGAKAEADRAQTHLLGRFLARDIDGALAGLGWLTVLAGDRYFDVTVEYAKAEVEDILIRINVSNRGPEAARLCVLPTIWFRNRWSWGDNNDPRPSLQKAENETNVVELHHFQEGQRFLHCEGTPELLFTENETNQQRLFNSPNSSRYAKDGINDYIVSGKRDAVNPDQTGTKCSANYALVIGGGETVTIRLRLTDEQLDTKRVFNSSFDQTFKDRIEDADEFYKTHIESEPKICL